MNLHRIAFSLFLSLFACLTPIFAAGDDGVWTPVDRTRLAARSIDNAVLPSRYGTFRMDSARLQAILAKAPEEFTSGEADVLSLPLPDGTLGRFEIEHSLVVEPGLLEKYPELGATYRGHGIDDPAATVRFDLLPSGFHAMVLSPNGTVMIDPYEKGSTGIYAAYLKRELPETERFSCDVKDASFTSLLNDNILNKERFADEQPEVVSGTQLRTYRLALSADNEYAVAVGGNTVAGTLAAQVLIMNRVNGVYERDLAIHMNIVANNNLIVFAGDNICAGVACTSANDPFTNSSGSTMLGENQNTIDTIIGSANYDIGHVFSTGGGGVAFLGVPCGGSKAGGVTGLSNPVGDAFAIDYVAHEMGHQWGANHTFNGAVTNCSGGNRSGSSAYETGSGITIMAYAGICGNQDLALHSIDTFHVKSLEAIVAYSQTGTGNTCGVVTPSGNTAPTVSVVGGPYTIPKQTPFALTAASNDINGDTVTYDWQEYDLGSSTTTVPNTDATAARPVFRPYLPSTSPTRIFPSINYILNNSNVPPATYDCSRAGGPCLVGELLPQVARTMNFQVVARDNHIGAGGINSATTTVNVDGNSGPFAITSHNSGSYANDVGTTITWNVAGTSAAPVNVANVKISFSTDGGLTFPIVLAPSTPNSGSFVTALPPTTAGRIKVEAIGNIFFDITDANITVSGGQFSILFSGKVQTPDGIGMKNAVVTMADQSGNKVTAMTNSFGTYSIVTVGDLGSIFRFSVTSKRYRFAVQTVGVNPVGVSNIVDFVGQE